MPEEQLYKQIPEIKPFRGDLKELEKIVDDQNHAIRLLKKEVERLQKEKQDG